MTLPSVMDLIQRSTAYLTKHGLSNARRETEWIFSAHLKLSRMELYTRFDMPIETADVEALRALITRRGQREPLAYVIGTQPFCDLTLNVGPGVLVPRPETEELVELIVAEAPQGARLLDIGTGSGAIALSIKHRRPDILIDATDVSTTALHCARANALTHQLDITFHHGHLASHVTGPYDVVVANLPYIGESERSACDPELAFEPSDALFSGVDGLDLIRVCIADLPRILAPHGIAWLEHGWLQGPAIQAIAQATGLLCTILPDSAHKDRFARITAPI